MFYTTIQQKSLANRLIVAFYGAHQMSCVEPHVSCWLVARCKSSYVWYASASFVIDAAIFGYKEIWPNPIDTEWLTCEYKVG